MEILILGIAKVQGNEKSVHSTIPKDAAKALSISPTDRLLFIKGANGDVILKKNGGKP